jgi:hypothetical protein
MAQMERPVTDYSLRTMDLNVDSLTEPQYITLRILEVRVLQAIASEDVTAWLRAMREMMFKYPAALPNPITVTSEFYRVLEDHLVSNKLGTDLYHGDGIMFRRVRVVAASAT